MIRQVLCDIYIYIYYPCDTIRRDDEDNNNIIFYTTVCCKRVFSFPLLLLVHLSFAVPAVHVGQLVEV